MFPLTNHHFQWGRSEVVIISPYIYIYMYNIIIVIFHININIHPQTILYMYTNFPDNLHSEVVIIYPDNYNVGPPSYKLVYKPP